MGCVKVNKGGRPKGSTQKSLEGRISRKVQKLIPLALKAAEETLKDSKATASSKMAAAKWVFLLEERMRGSTETEVGSLADITRKLMDMEHRGSDSGSLERSEYGEVEEDVPSDG